MTINTQKLRDLVTFDFELPVSVRDAVDDACDHIDAQAAEIARLRGALGEIADYWNRDQNDQAMYGACWHAINTANAALAQEQGESDESK